MPIIRAIVKPRAIIFLAFELELVQKYEIPKTAAINIAMGRINFIILTLKSSMFTVVLA